MTSLFLRFYLDIKSEKETSQLAAGLLCCCEVVRLRPPLFDLVTAAQCTQEQPIKTES